jgi:transposase
MNVKLTAHDLVLIRQLKEEGISVQEIAEKFEIGKETVYRAIRKKNWESTKKDMNKLTLTAVTALERIIQLPYNDTYSAKEIAWVALRKLRENT